MHPYARPAAIAAECAAAQGRFREYHDYLFQHQDSLGSLDWVRVAGTIPVRDTATFRRCLTGATAADQLRIDSSAAKRLNVTGTPTVMVNGWLLVGTPTAAELETAIAKAHR
jgi:protein-disulfide isomerase